MKTLYTYHFAGYYKGVDGAPREGHVKYWLELDRGKRINVDSQVRKLAKLNKGKRKNNRLDYLEPERILVGLNKLKRMYHEGRIVGQMPELIRTRLGAARLKERKDKQKTIQPKLPTLPKIYYIWDTF